MKRIVRLTERDLTRIVKRVIREQNNDSMISKSDKKIVRQPKFYDESQVDETLKSRFDSLRKKMENFLEELKSSGTEIDKTRFLKQMDKEAREIYWEMDDKSDTEVEGFTPLLLNLRNHFMEKLNPLH